MSDRHFFAEHVVPASRDTAFAFFATPRQLEAITPPWLRFRIVHQSTPDVREGTEFTYRLRIHGLPCTWQSRIEAWQPNERFVDVQLRGPYARWHHTHTFHDHPGGTLIRDHVLYRLPLGRLGDWAGSGWVAADLRKIFAFRAERTAALLGSSGCPAAPS